LNRLVQVLGYGVLAVIAGMAALGSLHITLDPTVFNGHGQAAIAAGTLAPDFQLTNAATGRSVALHQYQGRPVVLTFAAPGPRQSVAPATVIRDAQSELGPRWHEAVWLVVNANALPVSRAALDDWVRRAALSGRATVLTGNTVALYTVWTNYAVDVSVVEGHPVYTAATYVINREGRERYAEQLNLSSRPSAARKEAGRIVRALDPLFSSHA
jgi:hypothetical protein